MLLFWLVGSPIVVLLLCSQFEFAKQTQKNTKGSQVVSSVSLIVVFFQFSIFYYFRYTQIIHENDDSHRFRAVQHTSSIHSSKTSFFSLLYRTLFTTKEWVNENDDGRRRCRCNPLKETKNSSHREWRRNRDERRETRSRVYNLRLSFDTRFFFRALLWYCYMVMKRKRDWIFIECGV